MSLHSPGLIETPLRKLQKYLCSGTGPKLATHTQPDLITHLSGSQVLDPVRRIAKILRQ